MTTNTHGAQFHSTAHFILSEHPLSFGAVPLAKTPFPQISGMSRWWIPKCAVRDLFLEVE